MFFNRGRSAKRLNRKWIPLSHILAVINASELSRFSKWTLGVIWPLSVKDRWPFAIFCPEDFRETDTPFFDWQFSTIRTGKPSKTGDTPWKVCMILSISNYLVPLRLNIYELETNWIGLLVDYLFVRSYKGYNIKIILNWLIFWVDAKKIGFFLINRAKKTRDRNDDGCKIACQKWVIRWKR